MNNEKLQVGFVSQQIRAIEDKYGVTVIAVIEAGSHSWGFSTPESDLDIHFVYVQHPWAMKVTDRHDTLRYKAVYNKDSTPLEIDAQGYELRKFMGQIARSDPHAVTMLKGGTRLAGHEFLEKVDRCLVHFLNRSSVAEGMLGQAHRNLRPRAFDICAKGLVYATHFLLMAEDLLERGDFKTHMKARISLEDYSRLGSVEYVTYMVKELRTDLKDASGDELCRTQWFNRLDNSLTVLREQWDEKQDDAFFNPKRQRDLHLLDTLYSQQTKTVLTEHTDPGVGLIWHVPTWSSVVW